MGSGFWNNCKPSEGKTLIGGKELTRSLRNSIGINTKQPLAQLVVIPTEESTISQLEKYLSIIKNEMNIKDVEFSGNYQDLLEIELKLNFAVVGPKLGKSVGEEKIKLKS